MLIIGCGNQERMDDGAGILVAQRLRKLGMKCVFHSGDPLALIDAWDKSDDVIVIDTVMSGAPAGAIHIWDGNEALHLDSASPSTHSVGIAEAIELARTLARLPRSLCIYGIEGKQFGYGTTISPELEPAVEQVVRSVGARVLSKGKVLATTAQIDRKRGGLCKSNK